MISNIPQHVIEFLNKNSITAIDVGTRGGLIQFGVLEPFVNIMGFEADEEEAIIQQKANLKKRNFKTCEIVPYALWSSKTDVKEFYICNYLPNSSLLKPNIECARKFGLAKQFSIASTKKVKCITLESMIKNKKISPPDYIKIDAQGGDFEILKGLGTYINNLLLARLELLFVPLYYNSPTINDIDHFMHAKQFRLLHIQNKFPRSIRSRDINFQTNNDIGEFIWADVIYARDFEFLSESTELTDEKMIIYFLLLAYEGFESFAIDFLITINKERKLLPEYDVNLLITTILKDSYRNIVKNKIKPYIPYKLKKLFKNILHL